MSDFLDGLIQRSLATSVELKPRTPSLYEPIVLAPFTRQPQTVRAVDAPSVQTVSEVAQDPTADNGLPFLPSAETLRTTEPQLGRRPEDVPPPNVNLVTTSHPELDLDRLLKRLSGLISSESQPPTDTPSIAPTILPSSGSLAIANTASPVVSSLKRAAASTEHKTHRATPDVGLQTPHVIERTATREVIERSTVTHFVQEHSGAAPIAPVLGVAEKSSTVAMQPVPQLAQITRPDLPSGKVPRVYAPVAPNEPKTSSTPTVTVSIGRVEIRSTEPPSQAPVKSSQQKVSRVMSLDQYMALRAQGALS